MKHPQKFEAEVVTALHPLFRCILWAAQARSTDETRLALQHLHFEREGKVCKIVATDGKRMHVGTYDPGMLDDDIAAIEPGDYEVIAKTPKLIVLTPADPGDVSFPNWRGIIPSEANRLGSIILTRANVALIGMKTGRLVATDYAHQACGFGAGFGKDESVWVELSESGSDSVVTIKHELGTAYVMPMRMDEKDEATPESEAAATPEIDGTTPPRAQPDDSGDYDGPMIVDVDDEDIEITGGDHDEDPQKCLEDMRTTVAKYAKILRGKSARQKKEDAIICVARLYGSEGLLALEREVGDKIAGTIFARQLSDAIFDEQENEAIDDEPEGESDY